MTDRPMNVLDAATAIIATNEPAGRAMLQGCFKATRIFEAETVRFAICHERLQLRKDLFDAYVDDVFDSLKHIVNVVSYASEDDVEQRRFISADMLTYEPKADTMQVAWKLLTQAMSEEERVDFLVGCAQAREKWDTLLDDVLELGGTPAGESMKESVKAAIEAFQEEMRETKATESELGEL